MTKKIGLQVNGAPISLDYFVQAFIDHTVSGMLESLENTEPIAHLNLSIDGDKVDIMLNGKPVSANKFVGRIMKSTIFGMVSPLKGVSQISNVRIEITR